MGVYLRKYVASLAPGVCGRVCTRYAAVAGTPGLLRAVTGQITCLLVVHVFCAFCVLGLTQVQAWPDTSWNQVPVRRPDCSGSALQWSNWTRSFSQNSEMSCKRLFVQPCCIQAFEGRIDVHQYTFHTTNNLKLSTQHLQHI